MISGQEIRQHATNWGVPEAQIERDHLISHVLASLAGPSEFIFFGGTALHRTFIDGIRLSEDIDLLRVEDGVNGDLLDGVRVNLKKEFPSLQYDSLGRNSDVDTYRFWSGNIELQIQIVAPRYETSFYTFGRNNVQLRYSDLPTSVAMLVPTLETFGAMKLSAFSDRKAPRDLFDLGVLVRQGQLDQATIAIFRGLEGHEPSVGDYRNLPFSHDEWQVQLGHQLREPGNPSTILESVRNVLAALLEPEM